MISKSSFKKVEISLVAQTLTFWQESADGQEELRLAQAKSMVLEDPLN
jgi:hypothetical protein